MTWISFLSISLQLSTLTFLSLSVAVLRSVFPGGVPRYLRDSERTDGGGERGQTEEGEGLYASAVSLQVTVSGGHK